MFIDKFNTVSRLVWNAKGGGGGGSGGQVDYPAYQKQIQANWLAGGDHDDVSSLNQLSAGNDITTLLDLAVDNNPYNTLVAYNPSSKITSMESALTTLDSDSNSAIQELETYVDSISTTDGVEAELTQFDAGMRNINAVHSSAFVIGRQVVASGLIKEKLNVKGQIAQLKVEAAGKQATLSIDVYRLAIIALKEEVDKNIDIERKQSTWGIDVFVSASNVMAGIAGGTISKPDEGPSDMQSALAGGISGAATGAYIGTQISPGYGTAIGAAAGAVIGIGASLM